MRTQKEIKELAQSPMAGKVGGGQCSDPGWAWQGEAVGSGTRAPGQETVWQGWRPGGWAMGSQEAVGVLRRARGPRQGFWEDQGKGQAQQPSQAPEPWELCALRVLFPHIHTSCPASSFHSNSPFKTQLQGL